MKWVNALLGAFIVSFIISSCKHTSTEATATPEQDSGYYSIDEFILDQWNLYGGNSYGCMVKTIVNGKSDSVYINTDSMEWTPIIEAFSGTDISDPKYVGHYNFTQFSDENTGNEVISYTAKEDSLKTRILNVAFDPSTQKITSVYVEHQTSGEGKTVNRKMLYFPVRLMQMQVSIHEKDKPAYDSTAIIQFL